MKARRPHQSNWNWCHTLDVTIKEPWNIVKFGMKYAFNFDLCEKEPKKREKCIKKKNIFVFDISSFFHSSFFLAKRKSFISCRKRNIPKPWENVMPIFCIYHNIVITLCQCNLISIFLFYFTLAHSIFSALSLSRIHNLPHSITHTFIHSFSFVHKYIHTDTQTRAPKQWVRSPLPSSPSLPPFHLSL